MVAFVGVTSAMAVRPAAAEERAALLNGVKTWAYQLKDVSQDKIDKIVASPFDMVIIDSSMFPNGKEIHLTRAQVESMKKKPDGSRRVVVAYFSAGEAEDFRNYWKPEWNKNRPAGSTRPTKIGRATSSSSTGIRRGRRSSTDRQRH